MSRRFRPPPLAGFYTSGEDDQARVLTDTRERGYSEGHAQGLLEGHAMGHAKGAADAQAALEPELDALRETCAKQEAQGAVVTALRQLFAARDADRAALEQATREMAAATLRALFPALLESAAGVEIAALFADALTEREPETLTLRAHPDTLAAVTAEIAGERDSGRLMLSSDLSRKFGSADIAWTGGGITFDPTALLARVTSVLSAAATVAPLPLPLKASE